MCVQKQVLDIDLSDTYAHKKYRKAPGGDQGQSSPVRIIFADRFPIQFRQELFSDGFRDSKMPGQIIKIRQIILFTIQENLIAQLVQEFGFQGMGAVQILLHKAKIPLCISVHRFPFFRSQWVRCFAKHFGFPPEFRQILP